MGLKLKNETADRELLDEGSYPAKCIYIIDMGTQTTQYGEARKINFGFLTGEKKEDGSPFVLFRTFPAKITAKSDLGKAIKKWMKVEIEKGDVFDLDELLNTDCMISVEHSDEDDDGNVWDNIASITKLPKSMDPVKVPKKIEPFSLYLDDSFDKEMFSDLPDFIKDKIKKSPEYKSIIKGGGKSKSKAEDEDEEEEEDVKPRSRRGKKADDDDEDETPKRKKKPVVDDDDDDEEEKPKRRGKKPVDEEEEEEEEEEDEAPKRRKKPVVDEDDDEEEKPRRRRKPVVDEEEEEEEEEEEKPRRRKR